MAKCLLKYTCKSYLSFLCAMLHLYNYNLPGTYKQGNVTKCSIELYLCKTGFTDHTTENSTMYGCQIHFHTYLWVHVNLNTNSLPTIDHRSSINKYLTWQDTNYIYPELLARIYCYCLTLSWTWREWGTSWRTCTFPSFWSISGPGRRSPDIPSQQVYNKKMQHVN